MFKETLPHGCPPSDAKQPSAAVKVYRLLKNKTPVTLTDDLFLSYANSCSVSPPADVCPCRWSSCSLCLTREKAKAMRSLPKFKKSTHVCEVDLTPNSGLIKIDNSQHVDWWVYAAFSPVACSRLVPWTAI